MSSKTRYAALAFNDNLASGRSLGDLTVDESMIRFEGAGSTISFPVNGCNIKLGGASDRLVFFTHPSYPEWTIQTPDRNILSHRALTANPATLKQVNLAVGKRIFNWGILIILLLMMIAVPTSILVFMDPVTRVIARQLPQEWEQQLGKSALEEYTKSNTLINTPEVDKQLHALTGPLINSIRQDRYEFNLFIAKDENINAFALPGGYIVINSGLISTVSNADEILGVLAHEISHVADQHGIRGILKTMGVYTLASALIGDSGGIMSTLSGAVPLLINQSYSRSFEAEADDMGFDMLVAAKVNPDGLYRFFKRIQEKEDMIPGLIKNNRTRELMEKSINLLSSHPATRDRMENLQSKTTPPGIEFINLDDELTILQQTVSDTLNNQQEKETE